jgi:hypothetical protein
MAILTTINWVPQSESDKESVFQQLDRLFAHPTFRSSRRCPAFLQYIVGHQLKGDTQQLKERIIGAEVFGREPDYDTSTDPVVRTTASEVRKRIAQYYQESGHEGELRIELPLGSYAAEFHLPQPEAAHSQHPVQMLPAEPPKVAPGAAPAPRTRRWIRLAVAALIVILAIGGAVEWKVRAKESGIREFWQPIFNTQNPTLVCLNTWDLSGVFQSAKADFAKNLSQGGIDPSQWLPITDAEAFSRITAFLGSSQVNYRMEGAKATTLSDLMQGPSILIGIFGNAWTQRVSQPLRFYFVRTQDDPDVFIADRKDASKHWDVMDGASAGARDYAVIGRVSNPATGQISFIIAGLNAAGTTAASEFVTSPRYMEYLEAAVPNIPAAKNIEAVISVQVIDGRPGAPHLEAVDSW